MWNLCNPSQGHIQGLCIMYHRPRHSTQSVYTKMPKIELTLVFIGSDEYVSLFAWCSSVPAHSRSVNSLLVVIHF